jgi:hypothetical protein
MRAGVLIATVCALAALRGAADPVPSTIVRIELPPEADEHQPFALPTEPENTLEVDFPWPVEDWAGRGFTPDPEKFAGDFVIEATRGSSRLFVTPVAAQAHRILHVVLAEPGGRTRGIPLELVPAPTGLAWRKVVFLSPASPAPKARISLSRERPLSPLREPSPESELGLLRTMQLMLNSSADGAAGIAAANPALELVDLGGAPRSFGEFTLTCRFAVRDSTTDTLGLCVGVANTSVRRLLFDPGSWVIRAGDRVYPVRTVDFAGEIEPGASGVAFLVLTRAPDGSPTWLKPDGALQVSVVLSASANPRPVGRMALDAFDPR